MRGIEVNAGDVAAPEDPGPATMLQWVPIDRLVIDDAYQRPLERRNWMAIRKIAAAFHWSRFSPVFVVPVTGGRFALIDGQHRAHAAALCGFTEVPAQVVQMTAPEQAAAFAAVNGARVEITLYHVLKAALAAGETWAVAADRACAEAGCRLMPGNKTQDARLPGEIYTIRTVRDLVENGRGTSVTHALAELRASETGQVAEAWGAPVVKPWLRAACSRPRLAAAGAPIRRALDEGEDIWEIGERVDGFIRGRRRSGTPVAARHELMAAEIGTALDRMFPSGGAARAAPVPAVAGARR